MLMVDGSNDAQGSALENTFRGLWPHNRQIFWRSREIIASTLMCNNFWMAQFED